MVQNSLDSYYETLAKPGFAGLECLGAVAQAVATGITPDIVELTTAFLQSRDELGEDVLMFLDTLDMFLTLTLLAFGRAGGEGVDKSLVMDGLNRLRAIEAIAKAISEDDLDGDDDDVTSPGEEDVTPSPQDIVTETPNVTLNEESVTLRCENCGQEFVPKRSTARFCSDKCRQAGRRGRLSVTETPKG